ncbi:YdgA family protein [Undibacterium sp. CY18W]|uniref:YdgA family protein n=1 Tax=Undibacterium hunanense TaxID=2762292 RepID=A0ABR6ZZ05_9BURK|nr:YdgA family protein [Undibacterium hunanense]MBC3921097.1 YdgA family protein [Undibacterium hunanense]
MKISARWIALVVVLAVAYPAASWYTGKRVASNLMAAKDQPAQTPFIKIVKQDYQRGIFSSVEDTTVELNLASIPKPGPVVPPGAGESSGPDPATPAAQAASGGQLPSVQLRFISRIQHGPFPGFRSFGAASIKTELVLDPASKAQLEKIFGNANPLQINSTLTYGGAGHVSLSSPAFSTITERDRDKLTWQGVNLEVDFDKDYKSFRVALYVPGLTVDSLEGQSFKMGAITVKGDASKAYPTGPLYVGKSEATLASISVSDKTDAKKGFSMQQLSLSTDASIKDDFLSVFARLGVSKFMFDQQEFSNFHYDYGLKHLHAPSIAQISTAYSGATADPEKMAALKAVWEQVGPTIINGQPELVLERISIVTSDGEAKLTGGMKLVDANVTDISNIMALYPKVQGTLDITLTDVLVSKLSGATQKDPDMQKAALDAMNQQIASFVEQGYINRNGKLLNSRLEWAQGKLTVNGKAFQRPGS